MSSSMKIGNRTIDSKSPVLIIAEAGTAHLGELDRAKGLIDAAAEAGADCIKFQWVIADEIVHPNAGTIQLHKKPVTIWERFKALERPPEFYASLKEETERRKLLFLCSPFGPRSALGLRDLQVDAIKIASPELNHFPLLELVSDFPLILSTGISKLADIERSLESLRSPAALLHCITAYPAPEQQYNLRLLPGLAKVFGAPVGVSDHSCHPYLVPSLSVSQGAKLIEKHLTLNRQDGGLDDPIALEPTEFARMVRRVREAEGETADQLIKGLSDELGAVYVEKTLGDGIKKMADAESTYYYTSNRSIIARSTLLPGDKLNPDTFALLRSEQQQPPGLPPQFVSTITGRQIKKKVPAGSGITWDHLL